MQNLKIYKTAGIIQCLVTLLALLYLFFEKNDVAVLCIIIYALFLSFFVIKTQYEKLYFNNSNLIFFIFLYLYGIFLFLIEYILFPKVNIYVYKAVIIYISTYFTYLLGTYMLPKSDYLLKYEESSKDFVGKGYTLSLLVILVVLIAYKATFFITQGLFFNPSALVKSNRIEYFQQMSQLEVVLSLLIVSAFLYFVYYFKHLKRNIKYVIISLFIFYALMQLSAGNRRDFVPVIIGAFWVFSCVKKIAFTYLRFVLLLVVILGSLYFGTVRSEVLGGKNYSTSEKIAITLSSNEFVYPFYTLSYEVEKAEKNENYNYRLGETVFINPIINFIPREIYREKPKSLGTMFVEKYFGRNGMGFAFTPVSEFFMNFGYFGPAFCYFLIGAFLVYIQNRSDQRINFIFFTLLIDICRGEISSIVYQFAFVSLFLYLPSFNKLFK